MEWGQCIRRRDRKERGSTWRVIFIEFSLPLSFSIRLRAGHLESGEKRNRRKHVVDSHLDSSRLGKLQGSRKRVQEAAEQKGAVER